MNQQPGGNPRKTVQVEQWTQSEGIKKTHGNPERELKVNVDGLHNEEKATADQTEKSLKVRM